MGKEHGIETNQGMGKEYEIMLRQDMEKEYGLFLSQDKKETGIENEEIDRTVAAGQADITSILCNLLKQQSAPDVGLDVFDGNPLE